MTNQKVTSLDTQRKIKPKHDGKLTIATAASRTAAHWKNTEVSYGDFLSRVSSTVRTQETVAEYSKMTKSQQGDIKDVGGFVAGSLKNGKRRADSVAWRQLITLDADFIEGDFWAGMTMLFDSACAIYSTHKHTPEKPRLRLLIPLSRAVTAEEYMAISKKVAEMIGIDWFDDTTYQPHRLMYWPSTSRDGEFVFDYQDTEWLDPDTILAMYDDWTDPLEWPVSSRADNNHKKLADKQGDPMSKPGMIGAFNRTYSISEAIGSFLSDVYTDAGQGRYTYVNGSTQGGLVTYNDEFAYSHHGTDPCSEKLVNAFDMVRLHRFGTLDEDSKETTPVNKLPSTKAMKEFAQQDVTVKAMLVSEKMHLAQDDFAEEWQNTDSSEAVVDVKEAVKDKETTKWSSKLEFDDAGSIVVSARNLDLILENDKNLKGCFGWDEFRNQPAVTRDLPWRKLTPHTSTWGNGDDEDLRNYLDMIWDIRSSANKVTDVLGGVMRKHPFHPVREYLDACEWDGKPRVEQLLVKYLGADDNIYTRDATRKTLVAAVARIYDPGCKFDYMLTLVGEQGLGKSMLFSRLGGDWFSDSITSIHGKEGYEALHGVWIVEMAELAASRKSEVEAVKQFISKRVDRYRQAYGKRVEEFRRQCIMIGTTNERDFLRDKTGNRRFWPIPVSRERRTKVWDTLEPDEVKQLWAEAKHYYERGEVLVLDGKAAAKAAEMQESHTEESPYAGLISAFLEKKLPANWDKMSLDDRRLFFNQDHDFSNEFEVDESELVARDKVCALEIWCEMLGNDKKKFPMMDRREINDVLRNIKGWEAHDSSAGTLRFGAIYGSQRAYVRV